MLHVYGNKIIYVMTYGLIGKTLGHSFSRQFFTDKFSQEGIDGEYLNFELPEIDVFPTLFDGRDIRGLVHHALA